MLFADLLSLHLVTLLMLFILFHVTFFSSRCMLELKYYRAASLPSQASYAILAEESQAFFNHSPLTNSIPNSAILSNNYISLLKVQGSKFKVQSACAHAYTWWKWRCKGSHSSSASGSNRLVWLQTWKKAMGWCTPSRGLYASGVNCILHYLQQRKINVVMARISSY